MVLPLIVAVVLSFPPLTDILKSAQQMPFTETFVRDGKLVLEGKEFRATAHRFTITPDGKQFQLLGTDTEPARLLCRSNGAQSQVEVSGRRITFSRSSGTLRVEGAATLIESNGK